MRIDFSTIVLILSFVFLLLAGYFNFKRPKKRGASIPKDDFMHLRLQACERLILLMERISPTELVMRHSGNTGSTVADLQLRLLSSIRAEIEHNYSQQLYVSNDVWNYVIAARNGTCTLINQAATALPPDEPAIALSKRIIELSAGLNPLPTTTAIKAIKAEAQTILVQK